MDVTLYTTGCPKCMVLESKLDSKNIDYAKETDADKMIELGFSSAPMLKVDDELMDFGKAIKWINER